MGRFKQLKYLNIDCGIFNSQTYESLANLPNLQSLILKNSRWGNSSQLNTDIRHLIISKSLNYLETTILLSSDTILFLNENNIKYTFNNPPPIEKQMININFKFLNDDQFFWDLDKTDKIDNIKMKLVETNGLIYSKIKLIHLGIILDNDQSLGYYTKNGYQNIIVVLH